MGWVDFLPDTAEARACWLTGLQSAEKFCEAEVVTAEMVSRRRGEWPRAIKTKLLNKFL